jgi:MurNAc alpha-1-phosphate uridylyltransferase
MGVPVHAMLLAAGRGERMRPLTDNCPKPLLEVRGKALSLWHLDALARAGVARTVVNTAWLGEQFAPRLGAQHRAPNAAQGVAQRQPMALRYSHEGQDFGHALETAGGIVRALPLLSEGLGADPMFWVLAGDVYAPDFVFDAQAVARFAASDKLAHIWLVPNPSHNAKGDFGLAPGDANDAQTPALALNLPADHPAPRYTYSTIGLYRAALFAPPWCTLAPGNAQGIKAPLAPLLRAAMDQGRVSASLYTGLWTDVGTPERLQALNQNSNLMTATP